MKSLFYLTLFVLLIAPLAHADFKPTLFDQFFKAVGGRSNLENLKTIERAGDIEFPDHGQASPKGKGNYRTELIYPDKVRVHIDVGSYIYDELRNENIYLSFQKGGFKEVTDPSQKKQLDETSLKANRELLYWVAEHTEIENAKESPNWAKQSACVTGKKSEKSEFVCFDKKTHLLSAVGSPDEYRVYQEWKATDGIKFPMHLIHYKKAVISYEIKLSSLSVNKLIAAQNFEKPEEKSSTTK